MVGNHLTFRRPAYSISLFLRVSINALFLLSRLTIPFIYYKYVLGNFKSRAVFEHFATRALSLVLGCTEQRFYLLTSVLKAILLLPDLFCSRAAFTSINLGLVGLQRATIQITPLNIATCKAS